MRSTAACGLVWFAFLQWTAVVSAAPGNSQQSPMALAPASDDLEGTEPASDIQFASRGEPMSLTLSEMPEPAETPSTTSKQTDDEPEAADSKEEISKLANQLSNPVGELWVIVNQYNVNQIKGDPYSGSRWQNNLNVQPVLPLHLTDQWNLINRPIIPLYFDAPYPKLEFNPKATIPHLLKGPLGLSKRFDRVAGAGPRRLLGGGTRGSEPGRALGALSGGLDVATDRACGIGDITFLSMLSPREPAKMGNGHFIWGIGPTLIFPTASPGVFGQGKYQAGPAAVGLYMDKKWVIGALAQQWWSYADKGGGHQNINQLAVQYFCWYQFLPGWQLGSAPIATVDWTKQGSESFTFPVGIGIQHVIKIGKLPVKLGVEYEYAVVHPDDDAGLRSILRFTVAPVLPALVKGNLLN